MAEAVLGRDVIVEMLYDAIYYPILCGTDCEFVRTPEFIEKTTTTSGLFREFAVRREEWSVSVSGVTKVENDAALTFFYMLQNGVRRVQQTIRITFTDIDGDDKQISGNVLIGTSSISGPYSDFANCSIELKGTGAFVISAVTPPDPSALEEYSDYWATTNGLSYVSVQSSASAVYGYTLVDGDTILEVDVEGTQYDLVTGTPTDGRRECKYNTTTNRLEFPSDLVFDGNQRVFILFQR